MGEFNSDDHYIYYCGQESLRRNGIAMIVNKSLKCSTRINLKNDAIISIPFQSKPFNIMVIQLYALTSNSEEAEQFNKDLQDHLELTHKKDAFFIIRDWSAKVGIQEMPGLMANLALEYRMKQGKG